MQETLVEPLDRVADDAAMAPGAVVLLRQFFAEEAAQQVGAADDADELAVAHDRHALDVIGGQHMRDLAHRRALARGDDRRRHDVAHAPVGTL